jgi:predicted dinucleotide-binding enzyme
MKIGILGSGLMGGKLGTLFARAGHEVVFSYAHEMEKLKRLAQKAGPNARAGTPAEAAVDADALLLAVHWSRVPDVLRRAGDLAGKVLITCSLPMSRDDTRLVVAHTRSGAEALARKAPKARVVSAFGTVPSEVLFGVFDARLIRDVGFDPVDAGPLSNARYAEPFTMLIAQLAYEGSGGPGIAYRFERYRSRA